MQAQYVYGRGLFIGVEASYAKPYLTESNTASDGSTLETTFRGDSRAYGIDLVYAMNLQNYFSIEYRQRSTTLKHSSKYLLNLQNDITTQTNTFKFHLYRFQYAYFFKRTKVFVGGGLELAQIYDAGGLNSIYDNRLSGIANIGLQFGYKKTLILPYVAYVSPINSFRSDGQHELSLSEFRMGFKIWFSIL